MKKLSVCLFSLCCANPGFAYFTENISNGCGLFESTMTAEFQINEYTCSSGYFLPADSLSCMACPVGATCPGGTFEYNEDESQGMSYEGLVTDNLINMCSSDYATMTAEFIINEYTCDSGYYLPANGISCTVCLTDSYCPGGTYTFNETLTQGIVSCASGLFAPSGMWEAAQCGRILHVGDGFVYLRATKKTSPALHLDLDHDGVADYFGNMTTLDVPMSRDTQRKLKVRYNNTTYSIYDDSVELNQYQN